MYDSFSLLAKSIRQNKINKDELLNNLKGKSQTQIKKDKYIKNIIKIQKIIRGHLYRIKYKLSLDDINTKTIIDYLYEKKKKRIHNHSKEIISFFISKYIKKRRKKKNEILLEQYKIHCSDLIKARFKGILIRKKVKEQLLIKKAKTTILKFILGFRTKLILKSNTMQNLLMDIAKIKYQLKILDKQKDKGKLKELKNKLSKNINLFHDTYFYTKENCNWTIEKKTSEQWDKKYFDIINKKSGKGKNKNKKQIKSENNNGYTNYLLEFYNFSDEDNNDIYNEDIDQNFLTSNKKSSHYNSTLNSTKKNINFNDLCDNKKYETSKNISEFNLEESNREKNLDSNRGKNSKYTNFENINNYSERDRKNLKSDNISKGKIRKEINDIDLNNINYNKIKKNKDEIFKKSSTNIYQQREERPIKPLNAKNIIECKNPFGLRDNNFQKSNTLKQKNIFRNSMPYNNQFSNQYQKRNTMLPNIREKEEREEKNEKKEKYGCNRINSEKNNNYGYFWNRDEKPIGGGKKINYEEMFGEEGEINFVGDPFGGVKQFETNKKKLHNKSNSTAIRKKPIYDARKAIEEAKLKEAKEGKKEKHSEFRDFLKEMKKISAEEKIKNNKKENNNMGKDENESLNIKKCFSESLNKNGNGNENEISNGNNIYKNTNYIEEENKNVENNKKKMNNLTNNKRESSLSKSSTKMLRKKLHDLEKAPAPVLNIKGAKSKIECWFDNNNNNGSKYMEYTVKNNLSNKPNGQNKLRKSIIGEDDENINIMIKKMENKIEKYVDKKLSQLHLQIDKLNDIFSIESYFEQKEIKMKRFINIPYINKKTIYVKKYSSEIYEELINEINKEYKELK